MSDYFGEIIEYTGQIVTLVNWGMDVIMNVLNSIREAGPFQDAVQVVNAFPPEISALIFTLFSVCVFDFVRGR